MFTCGLQLQPFHFLAPVQNAKCNSDQDNTSFPIVFAASEPESETKFLVGQQGPRFQIQKPEFSDEWP